jgi:hypothetical protein
VSGLLAMLCKSGAKNALTMADRQVHLRGFHAPRVRIETKIDGIIPIKTGIFLEDGLIFPSLFLRAAFCLVSKKR